jgi:dimethylamine/trimethylamine dehydrogenase
MRLPNDAVFHELQASPERLAEAGIKSVLRIGDCFAPSTIAVAVYGGHRCAREMDEPPLADVPFKRELIELEPR